MIAYKVSYAFRIHVDRDGSSVNDKLIDVRNASATETILRGCPVVLSDNTCADDDNNSIDVAIRIRCRWLAAYFVAISHLYYKVNARSVSGEPPLCDLVSPAYSRILVARQYYAWLLLSLSLIHI